MADVKPKYEVEPFEGEYTVTVYKFDKKNKMVKHEETRTGGFMVYFPQGHSLHVRTKEDLEKLGLMESAPLINMETGEEIPQQSHTLKSVVASRTRNTQVARSTAVSNSSS